MKIIPLQQPLRAVAAAGGFRPAATAAFTFSRAQRRPELLLCARQNLEDSSRLVEGRRTAAVKSAGAYRIPNKKTLMKKMGAKKSGDQYVIPGNIIFKQRGTIWHPGENVIMGRDHTIHAAVTGYVKFYRDPELHPHRQFIGVAFNRDDTLPYPKHGVRRRKLNMVAVKRKEPTPRSEVSASGLPTRVIRRVGQEPTPEEIAEPGKGKRPLQKVQHNIRVLRENRILLLHDDYSYRESNVAIGRLMGRWKGKTPGSVRAGSKKAVYRAKYRESLKRKEVFRLMREEDAKKKKEAEERAKKAAADLEAKKAAAAKKAAEAMERAKQREAEALAKSKAKEAEEKKASKS
ncbi:hypothetical protein PspLS_02538 [Pyricularia sp. CBS 133598]|nr:hypothetical protein PspLS_02538 [Pyricularia sp. CBS 133598]